jgi:hypothetical protein
MVAIVVSFLTLAVTAPFSFGETFAAVPLGVIVTSGTVIVGNSTAPTGTTVFAGDRVIATSVPALINLTSGSRIEMTKAVATISRQGKTLVVQAGEGLLRFNFLRGEQVHINAGSYNFTTVGMNSAHVGELGLNRNGQVVLAVSEGRFDSLNTANGERDEVYPDNVFQATLLEGKGAITKGGNTLTDTSKSYKADELKGKCVTVSNERYVIVGNTANAITILGAWNQDTGSYDYTITCCAAEQGGKGSVTKGDKTLTDSTKTWQADALKGKCIVAGGEAYTIAGNTANTITIKGAWKLDTGSYDYTITCCDKDALVAAGATAAAAAGAAAAGAAAAAAAAAGAAAGAAVGISTAVVVGVVAGAAAAVGVGVGVYTAVKSPSSR